MVLFGGKEYGCTMELTLELIGGKWKALVLWHLGQRGILRFNELKRIHRALTQKMLTQQLRELEADGIVVRRVYAQVPPKVEYSLTPLGTRLLPVLESLCAWGDGYLEARGGEGSCPGPGGGR